MYSFTDRLLIFSASLPHLSPHLLTYHSRTLPRPSRQPRSPHERNPRPRRRHLLRRTP
jgi:hypothetical protein